MRRRTIAAIALALGVITAQQAATGPGAAVAEASAPSTGSAVLDWNQQTAAATRLIMPAIDPLNESRLYAMVHVAIHDALNTIDRRSRAVRAAQTGGTGREQGRGRRHRCARRDHRGPGPAEGELRPGLRHDRGRRRRGRLHRGARRDLGRQRQDARHHPRPRRGGGDPRRPCRRPLWRSPARRRRLSAGHQAWTVPLRRGSAARLRARVVQGHAVRAPRRVPVQASPAARRAQQEVRRRRQRGAAARRQRHQHAERPHDGRDPDRLLLVRELAGDVEPDRRDGGARRRASTRGGRRGCSR